MEKMFSEVMIEDVKAQTDPAQYGTSIQHYLIKMIHRILTALDTNSFAVIARC